MSPWKRNDEKAFYVVENEQHRLLCKTSLDGGRFFWAEHKDNCIDKALQFTEAEIVNFMSMQNATAGSKPPIGGVITPWKITCRYEISEATAINEAEREAALNKLTARERQLLGLE